MVQTAKVPFTAANVGKCMCPACGVQIKSACSAALKKGLRAAMAEQPMKEEKIPALYCGSGVANCKDLDQSQGCICGTCSLYTQYKLATGKPGGRFCSNGMAV